MSFRIHFLPNDITYEAEKGITFMSAVRNAGIQLDAPCGGNGTCGKCKVIINGKEKLACQTKVETDAEVIIPQSAQDHNILKSGKTADFSLDPLVCSAEIDVEKPTIGGEKSDWEAVRNAVLRKTGKAVTAGTDVMRFLHEVLVKTEYKPEIILYKEKVICVRERARPLLAVSFDIGTTTVVGYLMDLKTGKELSAASMLNPQSVYGADVIQRSGYAAEHGPDELNKCIIDALNGLIRQAAESAGADIQDIMLITLVGNSCMSHLFLSISPAPLTIAPYLPVLRETSVEKAEVFGLKAAEGAIAIMLPNIGGYVGADTVGAILSCGMKEDSAISLMIDIGTNGELALGNKDHIETCSTAAGPAFEGALIECGMRGAAGAIDHVNINKGELSYSVIGNGEAKGICGSGLIDIISELVKCGVVDEGGRIVSEEELEDDSVRLAERMSGSGPQRRFAISEKVYVTQKDIREVQLAKGAMAAGIKILMKKLDIGFDGISKVMIAGAFGNYMDPQSACGISLIPPELSDRIVPIGNAAGLGAQAAALDRRAIVKAAEISESSGYVELAVEPDFQDIFVDELEF